MAHPPPPKKKCPRLLVYMQRCRFHFNVFDSFWMSYTCYLLLSTAWILGKNSTLIPSTLPLNIWWLFSNFFYCFVGDRQEIIGLKTKYTTLIFIIRFWFPMPCILSQTNLYVHWLTNIYFDCHASDVILDPLLSLRKGLKGMDQ